MRKYLVLIICLILFLGVGCGSASNIPKGMSSDFYNFMVDMDGLIQKSIDAKYNYLVDETHMKKYDKKIKEYFYYQMKDTLTQEQKDSFKNKGYDLDIKLTEIESHTYSNFVEISIALNNYIKEPDIYKKELIEKHNSLKELLKP